MPSPESSVDLLYRGFPDFAAWGPLAAADVDLWSRFAANLEERRKTATPEALKNAVDVAVRAAALDTGAIEGLYDVDRGFTMTVAVQGLAWEQMIEERGADVRKLFEAQLEAYELVLDVATRRIPITEAWIRSLHEVLCAPQETYRALTPQGWQEQELLKGEYKRQPNHVRLKNGTFHAYAPVDRAPAEMHRLLDQIQSVDFESAQPILQASYIHYALVAIHPFADGNGRVARALASVFFYRACSIPFLVFANQLSYFDALQAADEGDSEPLRRFFMDRGIDTMQLVTENLVTAEAPAPEAVVERIKRKYARERLSSETQSSIGLRLKAEIERELLVSFSEIDPSVGLRLTRLGPKLMAHQPLTFSLAHPATGRGILIRANVEFQDMPGDPFRLHIVVRNSDDVLKAREEEVFPELTETFKLRLRSWLRRHLGRALVDLENLEPFS